MTSTAQAQMHGCSRPPAGAYAVFIDEPAATPAAFRDRGEVLEFMNHLTWTLNQSFVGGGAGLPHAEVRFQSCESRSPRLDGSDFNDPANVETLYNGGTILEFWGSLDAHRQGNTRTNASAQINYLLVPVQFATDQNEIRVSGILGLAYPEYGARPTGDFTELLTKSQNIDALLAASLGYKALRERRYDLAHDNLCQAGLLLAKIAGHLITPRQKADTEALRGFVVQSAGRAITAALADPHYSGTLKLLNATTPCPGAGTVSGTPP